MADFVFKIVAHIAVLSTSKHGWQKELNRVEWGGRPAAYDIRLWSPDHKSMSRGVTLTDAEFLTMLAAFKRGGDGSKKREVNTVDG